MSSKKTNKTSHPIHAAQWRRLRDLSGPPPLLPGEDHDAYEALWMGIAVAMNPWDFVEVLDVQNLADATWNDWRRRRCELGVLKAAIPGAIARLLSRVMSPKTAEDLANSYLEGDEEERADVEAALADRGFTMDDVRGVAFEIRLLDLETLHNIGAKTQWRRGAIHREISRRRESLARLGRTADAGPQAHGATTTTNNTRTNAAKTRNTKTKTKNTQDGAAPCDIGKAGK